MNEDDPETWICETLLKDSPSPDLVRLAAKHLSRSQIQDLFSSSNFVRRNAEGYLFEAIVYEMIVELACRTDAISQVVRKGIDVPQSRRTGKPKPEHDGPYYNAKGELIIRLGGIDLAELDIAFVDKMGHLVFCEVKTSFKNMKNFDKKASYNKQLFNTLFGNKTRYLLVSSVNIENITQVQNIISVPGNYYAYANWFNDDLKRYGSMTSGSGAERQSLLDKFCFWTDLEIESGLNYEEREFWLRADILASITMGKSREEIIQQVLCDTIVPRVIVGMLCSDAIDFLIHSYELEGEGKDILPDEFKQRFSSIVLSLSALHLRPVLYLRERKKRSYVKMGPCGASRFAFERNIVPWRTTFFSALENARYQVNASELANILGTTMVEEAFERKKKAGHHFSLE
ncbi:MAG: hypothetical protein JRN15_11625 [Nitrososphaerota archaeon]|nr:hypothetical protein [Nitrososphaerota archaeon]